jgi:hypothetical protein
MRLAIGNESNCLLDHVLIGTQLVNEVEQMTVLTIFVIISLGGDSSTS